MIYIDFLEHFEKGPRNAVRFCDYGPVGQVLYIHGGAVSSPSPNKLDSWSRIMICYCDPSWYAIARRSLALLELLLRLNAWLLIERDKDVTEMNAEVLDTGRTCNYHKRVLILIFRSRSSLHLQCHGPAHQACGASGFHKRT